MEAEGWCLSGAVAREVPVVGQEVFGVENELSS